MLERWRGRWDLVGLSPRRELLIAALLLFAYGFFQQQPAWNEYSRYDLVRAVVEQGTTRIDTYHQNTGDAALYQGHWYSDKSPGSALLGVPVYALLTLVRGLPAEVDGVQALAFVESGIATVVLVLLLIRFLGPFIGETWATGVGLAYGLGSMAFPFATMLFGHAASSAGLFAAFYLLHRQKLHPGRWGPVVAGFLAGWAVLVEVPVVLGVAVLLIYAAFLGRGVVARFVAGGIPLALVLIAYNWLTFGSPLSIGYQFSPTFQGQNEQGLISIVWPQLSTTWELLFGPRGLLRLAPWFALAPLGLVALRRRDARFEVLLAALVCAAFLTYNSGALNPFGGWTPGPRYLMPALPFAAVLVAFVPRPIRLLAAPLMLVGAAVFFVATATMPNAPERFTDPLVQLWLPRFEAGQIATTAAWVRWGLGGYTGTAVLLLALAFGALGVARSFGPSAVASSATTRAAAAMAVLLLAFSVPFPPLAPIGLGWQASGSSPVVSIAELSHVTIRIGDTEEVSLAAHLENRGGAVAASRLRFIAWAPDGEGVWSAWYDAIPIAAGSRQTVTMTWHPGDVPPGPLTYGFTVSDSTSGTELATGVAADRIVLGR
ncbi:MAG TPA: hypothetical protein VL749_05060 [Patescibacteria group bacterium]|nr:hypothetical protein [Patescibacteria group bacterium]